MSLLKKIFRTIKRALRPRLDLVKGTRMASFFFIFFSMMLAAGVLLAANTYYNLDTGEVVNEEIQRITDLTRATGGLIAGGGSTDNLNAGVNLQVSGGDLRVGAGYFTVDESTGNTYIGGTSTMSATSTFGDDAVWEAGDGNVIGFGGPTTTDSGSQIYRLPRGAPTDNYVLTTDSDGDLSWQSATGTGVGAGDITAVGDVDSGDAFTPEGAGTTLWFHNNNAAALKLAGELATNNATFTLPALDGKEADIAVATSSLSAGGLLFANGAGVLTQDPNALTWDSANGYLGIGTSTPNAPLTVRGTTTLNGISYSWPGSANDGKVLTYNSGGSLSWGQAELSDDDWYISGSQMYATSGVDYVGIGTTSPQNPLDVAGAIRAGASGQAGQLRIATADGNQVIMNATSAMTANTEYYLPENTGESGYVLTTSGSSGQLQWESATGTSALGGEGTTDRLAKWTASDSLGNASIEDLASNVELTIGDASSTFATSVNVGGTLDANYVAGYKLAGDITGQSNDITGIGTFSGATATLASVVQAPEFTATSGTTTIGSAGSGGILLDPASGKVKLADGADIKTDSGYGIATTGKQVLREMVPVMGFDLPIQCNTACDNEFATATRVTENVTFADPYQGATRKYKFVIRYADATSTAGDTAWKVATSSNAGSLATFNVPHSSTADVSSGETYITSAIDSSSFDPTADRWFLKVNENAGTDSGYDLRIFEVYLAAYDEIQ